MSALFLREAVTRLSVGRVAWVWILFEPLAHVIVLMTILGFILHKAIEGVDGAMFVVTGLFGFFVARNTALRCADAIDANEALFSYRQVRPIDPVIVRAGLELFLMLLSSLLLLAGAGLVGYNVIPHDPLKVMAAFTGLWLCGLGIGLILSALSGLIKELSKVVRILFIPLYFISGVMYPAMVVPQPYRGYLLYNPFLNGLEVLRAGFFPQFHPAPEASLLYLYGVTMVLVFFGLLLHVRFAERLVAK